MAERLQKILARWGVASRRQAEQLIQAGRVRLNGTVVRTLGQRADAQLDDIEVDGQRLQALNRPEALYLLLHKPAGVLCTCDDPRARRTVLDLIPVDWRRGTGLHPVGRLDADSTGALVLTNDGDLTYHLTHPHRPDAMAIGQPQPVAKTYQVQVQGHPKATTLARWRAGVTLDRHRTLPAGVRLLSCDAQTTRLEIVLREGRNRQIRRVAELLGHPVLALHRLSIGPLQLGALPVGSYRLLTAAEVHQLKVLCSHRSSYSEPREIEGERSA